MKACPRLHHGGFHGYNKSIANRGRTHGDGEIAGVVAFLWAGISSITTSIALDIRSYHGGI